MEDVLNSLKRKKYNLQEKKLSKFKEMYTFLDMNKEYNKLLEKIMLENHVHGLTIKAVSKKNIQPQEKLIDTTSSILSELTSNENSLCDLESLVLCQSNFFSSTNQTKEQNQCNYLAHMTSCATKTCSKSSYAINLIKTFSTNICKEEFNKKTKLKTFQYNLKKVKDLFKIIDLKKIQKEISSELSNISTLNLDDVDKSSLSQTVNSELYYKKDDLKGITSECILPHFDPKYDLKSCNKKDFYICREIIMAELVLTEVHFCPNCENENAYDICICKCCVAKELLDLCYEPNCEDEYELARYSRYIGDICEIKPVVTIDNVDKENTEQKSESQSNLNKRNLEIEKQKPFEMFEDLDEIIKILPNNADVNEKMKNLNKQVSESGQKKIHRNKNDAFKIMNWKREDEILAQGCHPYDVSGVCYHDRCCYPPASTEYSTIYTISTETDIMVSTILRYKLALSTTTETQLLESTITVQVPATTHTKYKKKLIYKKKKTKTVTVTTTSTTTSVSTTTATVTVTTTPCAANVLGTQNVNDNKRPTIPNLIKLFGSQDNNQTFSGNVTDKHFVYSKKSVFKSSDYSVDNRYLQLNNESLAGNISTTTIIASNNNNFLRNSSSSNNFSSLNDSNKSSSATFENTSGKKNVSSQGLIISLITVIVAYLSSFKGKSETSDINISDNSFDNGDINEHINTIERGDPDLNDNSDSLNDETKKKQDNDEIDISDFPFVVEETERLFNLPHSEMTDSQIIEKMISEVS
ncbi:hypothetical protein HANVADRAFT_51268 [Hanseniaspora valbyensis NRRL Y-1626]|uniref:Uncharacterized protein n=1 Tax=Hanseniaspora valbyensis NRRL Y-1626 TaxID=766949 RepID=A0A1B7TJB1_9ASCO|nr:hypothetical protein HANVADRAFT_51268 [Hanseniaspora valbyensis NRRL Y-1626]